MRFLELIHIHMSSCNFVWRFLITYSMLLLMISLITFSILFMFIFLVKQYAVRNITSSKLCFISIFCSKMHVYFMHLIGVYWAFRSLVCYLMLILGNLSSYYFKNLFVWDILIGLSSCKYNASWSCASILNFWNPFSLFFNMLQIYPEIDSETLSFFMSNLVIKKPMRHSSLLLLYLWSLTLCINFSYILLTFYLFLFGVYFILYTIAFTFFYLSDWKAWQSCNL